jgi:hypothetical protein
VLHLTGNEVKEEGAVAMGNALTENPTLLKVMAAQRSAAVI